MLFELREPIYLELLFLSRCTGEFYFRRVIFAVAIFIQANDRTSPVINLLLVTMRSVLDLAALITIFHRSQYAAESLDFAKLIEDGRFHRALDCFHPRRAAQHVHGVFEDAGFFKQDRLAVGGEPDPFFARRRERLIRAV